MPTSWNGPPSTLTANAAIPEPESNPVHVTKTDPAVTRPVGAMLPSSGFVVSMRIVMEVAISAFPTPSTEANRTVCVPSPLTVNGAMYSTAELPSTAYTVAATPVRLSVATRATETLETYHPFGPRAPARFAVVTGGVVST